MDTIDIGLLIIGVWVGLVIVIHGVNHARGFFIFRPGGGNEYVSTLGLVALGLVACWKPETS